jgi:hypothetical protein
MPPPEPPIPPSPQPIPGSPIPAPGAPKKKSGCGGCLLGCLVVFILAVLLVGGCGWFAAREINKKTEGAVVEFTGKGFTEEKSEVITKDQPVQGKKLLYGKYMTVVSHGSDSELAVISYVAIIDGPVQGNLYFRGGGLVIGPDAAIYGDVDVDCYSVMVQGYVQGQIKGKYQQLDETQRKKTAPAFIQETPAEEVPAAQPPPAPSTNAADAVPKPPQETPPPPTEAPPAPPPPATPPPPTQPNAPDQQPPADSPAPPADPQTPPPATEPTPPDPKPTEPAPTPPAPAPPSQR